MSFDLFHSVSDLVVGGRMLGARRCFEQLLRQVQLAQALGMSRVWCAESHFSSEAQKQGAQPAIPSFDGEVDLSAPAFREALGQTALTRHAVSRPDKQVLLERALVGDAAQLREQLAPGARHGFQRDDRLMLWFEFNQQDGAEVERQMRHFFEHVVEQL